MPITEEEWADLGRPEDPKPQKQETLEQVLVTNLSGEVDAFFEPKKGGAQK
jgi:hypothetical protein